jgi:chromosome segregation ATPase
MSLDNVGQSLPPSGTWTGDALYNHFTTRHNDQIKEIEKTFKEIQDQMDRRIDTQARERSDTEKHLTELVEGLRRELKITEDQISQRLMVLNKLREAVEEDRRLFVGREEIGATIKSLEQRLDKAERDLDKRMGAEMAVNRRKQDAQPWQIWVSGAALAVIIVIVNILIVVLGGPS